MFDLFSLFLSVCCLLSFFTYYGECTTVCEGTRSNSDCYFKMFGIEDDIIECNGYQSCWYSKLTCTNECDCYGEMGCQQATISASIDAKCSGFASCYQSTISTDWAGIVKCNGDASCKEATISSTWAVCDGNKACESSTITDAWSVYYNGFESGKYATVTSDLYYTEFLLSGFLAGNGLSIICTSDAYCSITCHSTNSCAGVKVYNYGEYGISCGNNDGCFDCPTVYDYSSLDISDEIKAEWDKYREEKAQLIEQFNNEFNEMVEENGYDLNNAEDAETILQLKETFEDDYNMDEKLNDLEIKYNMDKTGKDSSQDSETEALTLTVDDDNNNNSDDDNNDEMMNNDDVDSASDVDYSQLLSEENFNLINKITNKQNNNNIFTSDKAIIIGCTILFCSLIYNVYLAFFAHKSQNNKFNYQPIN